MAMEATRVTFGIFPPIINTTPNSPRVWAKVRTKAVNKGAFIFGSRTWIKVCHLDFPRLNDASDNELGNCCNAYLIGPTIKGML